ncbi:unnamed protein product [Leptosia nina]|uniref:Uncharacterized protein n=1 Tax=Leptosia nina TaxID=320188 RepID=A0AAV1IT52_9NEOP
MMQFDEHSLDPPRDSRTSEIHTEFSNKIFARVRFRKISLVFVNILHRFLYVSERVNDQRASLGYVSPGDTKRLNTGYLCIHSCFYLYTFTA